MDTHILSGQFCLSQPDTEKSHGKALLYVLLEKVTFTYIHTYIHFILLCFDVKVQ